VSLQNQEGTCINTSVTINTVFIAHLTVKLKTGSSEVFKQMNRRFQYTSTC